MRTLVILTAQDREIGATYESLRKNVLIPLNADLGFCGVALDEVTKRKIPLVWDYAEPVDWLQAFLDMGISRAQIERFEDLGPEFFAGLSRGLGSAAIVFYWRHTLSQVYEREINGLSYDWFAITRSDIRWAAPFPSIKSFSPRHVYYLDSQHYGGIEDRFVLFNKRFASRIFSLYSDLFEDPEAMLSFLENHKASGATVPKKLNAEGFQYLQLKRKKLLKRVRYFPYIGYTIRSADGNTRWSAGVWDESEKAYIKYPSERRQARHFSKNITESSDWGKFPKRVPGPRVMKALLRWRLKLLRRYLRSLVSRGPTAIQAQFRIPMRRVLRRTTSIRRSTKTFVSLGKIAMHRKVFRISLADGVDPVSLVCSPGGVATTTLMDHLSKFVDINDPKDLDGLKHPPGPPINAHRILFVKGSDKQIARSIARRGWLGLQGAKLGSFCGLVPPNFSEYLFSRAVRRQTRTFEKYRGPSKILILSWEDIWARREEIADFFEVTDPKFFDTFPPRRSRETGNEPK